ncbi:FHA domain-containing protein [Klenkia terrae]|uniref:FHA domain-containing protein n=1 Tax=Klenkia terrae TaxID=1052259 RepID=UPI00360BD3CA
MSAPEDAVLAQVHPALAAAGLPAEGLWAGSRSLTPDTPLTDPALRHGARLGVDRPGPRGPGPGGALELHVCGGPGAGRTHPLTRGVLVVGRGRGPGHPPAARLAVPDGQVSRAHVEVTVTGSGVVVRDLGSANGSRLDRTAAGGAVARSGPTRSAGRWGRCCGSGPPRCAWSHRTPPRSAPGPDPGAGSGSGRPTARGTPRSRRWWSTSPVHRRHRRTGPRPGRRSSCRRRAGPRWPGCCRPRSSSCSPCSVRSWRWAPGARTAGRDGAATGDGPSTTPSPSPRSTPAPTGPSPTSSPGGTCGHRTPRRWSRRPPGDRCPCGPVVVPTPTCWSCGWAPGPA